VEYPERLRPSGRAIKGRRLKLKAESGVFEDSGAQNEAQKAI
jgi:hypothetical protein